MQPHRAARAQALEQPRARDAGHGADRAARDTDQPRHALRRQSLVQQQRFQVEPACADEGEQQRQQRQPAAAGGQAQVRDGLAGGRGGVGGLQGRAGLPLCVIQCRRVVRVEVSIARGNRAVVGSSGIHALSQQQGQRRAQRQRGGHDQEGRLPAPARLRQQHQAAAGDRAQAQRHRADAARRGAAGHRQHADRQRVDGHVGPGAGQGGGGRQREQRNAIIQQVAPAQRQQHGGVGQQQRRGPAPVAAMARAAPVQRHRQQELEHGRQAGQLEQAQGGAGPAVLAQHQRQPQPQIDARRGQRQVEPAEQGLGQAVAQARRHGAVRRADSTCSGASGKRSESKPRTSAKPAARSACANWPWRVTRRPSSSIGR
ncbi:Uncharacterised protein [Achromobacter xylosoxidans]|nr:Uncharacterised protein [Achromobacter xylosoxidans]